MKKFQYVIQDELGIHARPAGMLARIAKKYESTVEIGTGDRNVSASQLLRLMSLGVKKGDEVSVVIEGVDEEAACAELKAFFEEHL
ncbi:MAG: HPr family phosphocarrier protein [Clostridium sp.]|nr:HPr family phosphocarrier protein [Clostridiaceae bacterium]MDD6073330.1 HPr family phosphocarrier protein [Clostridium sp.]MDY5483480.1 HPr family phosphocarrier protein [Clostridium sp.]